MTCVHWSNWFVTHRMVSGPTILTVQELPGHKDGSITMIRTHVLNKGGRGVTRLPD